MARDLAREIAAAAAKEVHRFGAPGAEKLLTRLLEEASAYERWQIHASQQEMEKLLLAEWAKIRGRSLGGHVAAAARR